MAALEISRNFGCARLHTRNTAIITTCMALHPCRPFDAPTEVLLDAGVELGSNYDWPIVTDSEAQAHVAHACHVIERCIATRTGSEGKLQSLEFTAASLNALHPEPSACFNVSRPELLLGTSCLSLLSLDKQRSGCRRAHKLRAIPHADRCGAGRREGQCQSAAARRRCKCSCQAPAVCQIARVLSQAATDRHHKFSSTRLQLVNQAVWQCRFQSNGKAMAPEVQEAPHLEVSDEEVTSLTATLLPTSCCTLLMSAAERIVLIAARMLSLRWYQWCGSLTCRC